MQFTVVFVVFVQLSLLQHVPLAAGLSGRPALQRLLLQATEQSDASFDLAIQRRQADAFAGEPRQPPRSAQEVERWAQDVVITGKAFWDIAWGSFKWTEVLLCGLLLFIFGIACAAAGVGGGGVFVVLLMVCGRLSVHDAVPMSKTIVFTGAVSTTIMNMRRYTAHGDLLVDMDMCRVIVPASLLGTFFGVAANFHAQSSTVLAVLAVMLLVMTALTFYQAIKQYREEDRPVLKPEASGANGETQEARSARKASKTRGTQTPEEVTAMDTWTMVLLLVAIVVTGALRYRVQACDADKDKPFFERENACFHGLVAFVFGDQLEWILRSPGHVAVLNAVMVSFPALVWAGIASWTSRVVGERSAHWTCQRICLYQALGILTGVIAGLIGVGGGLILSPAFLLIGMDPSIAVGTSSTCVLFTSMSTTLQYSFTGRVIFPLAIVYGAVTVVSSCCGTHLVHLIRQWFPLRKSYISFLVAFTVLLSVILVLYQSALAIARPEEESL